VSGTPASAAGFAVLLVAALTLQVAGRRREDRVTAGQALAAAMRTTPGRATVLVAWLWLGVHFLAR
jgi:hypothetical protein